VIRKAVIIAVGVLFAALSVQVPAFIQSYTQRLGGWRDAYALQLKELDDRAKEAGYKRDDYVAALRASDDPNAVREGNYLALLPGYHRALHRAYKDLTEAPPWMRAVRFAEHYNAELAASTWKIYTPAGVPATPEGIAYAGVGFLAGWGFVSLGGIPYGFWRRRRQEAARRKKFEGFDPL
jgi:hypothetical protein